MSAAAGALSKAGASIYPAVRDLDDGVDRMAAAKSWRGASHKSAAAMLTRATAEASTFKHYTEAIAQALSDGAGTIGTARTALLNHADEVERGELSVNDICPAR